MKVLKGRVLAKIGTQEAGATAGYYIRIAVILACFSLSYLGIFSGIIFEAPPALSLLSCLVFGLSTAAIGFNVFHDSVHGALSRRRWVNRFWAFTSCSLIGASHYIWKHKHNYLHHQFPNVKKWDDDLETREGLRLSPSQSWSPRYRYQHIYAPFIYSLTTIEWLFFRDFVRYFTGSMNEFQKIPKMKPSDHLEFWISKAIYIVLAVVIPLLVFSLSQFIIGFLVVHLSASLVLAIIFQLAHVMTETDFPESDPETGQVPLNWVQLQLATTINFAPSNSLLYWYCGGLNFQVEHHLFPGLCNSYYRAISPLVEATAKEFGYPYHSLRTHGQAIKDHYEILKKFSRPDNK